MSFTCVTDIMILKSARHINIKDMGLNQLIQPEHLINNTPVPLPTSPPSPSVCSTSRVSL